MKYKATDRKWVQVLLSRLTPAQRVRYEAEMRAATGDWRTGQKYDRLKAEIAEKIMLDAQRRTPA